MEETGDSVSIETTRLSYFAVCDVLKSERTGAINRYTEVETCLKGCILKMLEKHEITFNGMMSRLQIDRTVDFNQGFYEIAQELFKDDVSWAKIVALFAFGARLGQYCRENSLEDLVVTIAENLAAFANHNISPFVRIEGGWVIYSI